jgi:nitroreductase
METWDAIRARRNVREFTDEQIPEDDLVRIVEAGRRAPSSRNWQPWDFVLVTDRETLEGLSHVWRGAGHVAGAAAAVVIVSPLPDDHDAAETIAYDVGQATMAMMIAAADVGIGTGHSSVQDQELARSLLGIPDDRFVPYLFSVGYPADRPLRPLRRPNRRPLEEVLHRERW